VKLPIANAEEPHKTSLTLTTNTQHTQYQPA